MPRYALYYAPDPGSVLWRFGSSVLGYDAVTGTDLPAPDLPGFDAQSWHALTVEPRRYGFHATLKAPFRLAEGYGEADIIAAATVLARTAHPFALPELEVAMLGPFVTLVPAAPCPRLDDLAEAAVIALDPLRAPLTAVEIARRRPEQLSARQVAYLAAHGYPYVRKDFRFHMTLTGALPEDLCAPAFNALRDAYAALAHPPETVDRLCLFVQRPGEHFRRVMDFPLGG